MNKFIGSEKLPAEKKPKPKEKGQSILQRALGAIRAIKRKKSHADIKVKEYIEIEVDDVEIPALPEASDAATAGVPKDNKTSAGVSSAPIPESDAATEFITVLDEDGEVCVVPATESGES